LQPNADTDDGITPLISAVAAGSLACLEILIQVPHLSQSINLYFPALQINYTMYEYSKSFVMLAK